MLIITFSGYLSYVHVYTPWENQRKLAEVANQIELGDYLPARDILKQLLLTDLSSENTQTAREMLAQITLAITQQKAEKGNVDAAKVFLKKYLAVHGHGKEAEALWDRLDYYRLTLGEQLESKNQHIRPFGRTACTSKKPRKPFAGFGWLTSKKTVRSKMSLNLSKKLRRIFLRNATLLRSTKMPMLLTKPYFRWTPNINWHFNALGRSRHFTANTEKVILKKDPGPKRFIILNVTVSSNLGLRRLKQK
jgi:hypothetical protein